MNKNEEYKLEIEDMSSDGEGIGHVSEQGSRVTVFVKDTVVGDVAKIKIIKVKKNLCYGRLVEIITPSPYRVEPTCSKAASCGGCYLMHMSYEKQLEYKQNKVKNCLERIGGFVGVDELMEPICGMDEPYHYRNKMQFPVGVDKDGRIRIGFYAGRTHYIIDIDECVIGHQINTFIIKNLRAWITAKYQQDKSFVYSEELHRGLIRHIVTRIGYSTGELGVCIVINETALKGKLSDELTGCLLAAVDEYNQSDEKQIKLVSVSLNINTEKTNKILGDKNITIYGRDYIRDYIGDICFNISPQSFYQVNPVQTKRLYDKALSYADLHGEEVVWDMYCGIGTISLFLARQAKKVYGVEIVPKAIEDAKENARLNKLENTEFYCGKAEEVAPRLCEQEEAKPDVVVVDPPRKGCDASLLDTIAKLSPEKVVYVSCDPATLARDVKYLSAKGYSLDKVAAYDQFGHSVHVEVVSVMSRRSRRRNG